MNQEQFQGKWEKFKGEPKQKWGKFIDNDRKEIEGNFKKFKNCRKCMASKNRKSRIGLTAGLKILVQNWRKNRKVLVCYEPIRCS